MELYLLEKQRETRRKRAQYCRGENIQCTGTGHTEAAERAKTKGDTMTNEELAIRAKAHDDFAVLELWEGVRRFVEMKAVQYLIAADFNSAAERDDLIQDGFFAMLDAVNLFDPERGAGFLTILSYTLRKRFAEEGGHRTSKRDPLLFSESLNTPLHPGEEDGGSVADAFPDPCGEYAFSLIEYEDYIDYTRRLLHAAMSNLTVNQADCIEQHYFHHTPLHVITGSYGADRRVAFEAIKRGLRTMRRGKYRKELWDALQGFYDFREFQYERRRAVELQSIAKNN